MHKSASIPSVFVRRLGGLDTRFSADYSFDLANVDSYPYGVMAFFEAFLCQQRKPSIGKCKPLLRSAMDVIENGLRDHYGELQNIVEVAFIEKLFDDDNTLYKWILDNGGPRLKYEMLAFRAKERGYRIINAVRECFATLPITVEEMISKAGFLERLAVLEVPYDRISMLDVWGHPHEYHLEFPRRDKNNMALISVTSLASARGHRNDIQVIG